MAGLLPGRKLSITIYSIAYRIITCQIAVFLSEIQLGRQLFLNYGAAQSTDRIRFLLPLT